MNRALVLSAFLLSAAAAVCGCGQDPPLAVAQNLDLGHFSGQWYEIAKLPRVTETDCWATTAEYTMGADGALQLVHRCNVGSLTGNVQTVTMSATAPDPTVPAKLALDVMGFSGDYWILEVGANYEYAVVGHPSRSYLWILSRTPTLDDATLQGALARAGASGFDTTKLEYTPQPGGPATPQGNVPPRVGTGCAIGSGEPAGAWMAAGALVAVAMAAARRRRTQNVDG